MKKKNWKKNEKNWKKKNLKNKNVKKKIGTQKFFEYTNYDFCWHTYIHTHIQLLLYINHQQPPPSSSPSSSSWSAKNDWQYWICETGPWSICLPLARQPGEWGLPWVENFTFFLYWHWLKRNKNFTVVHFSASTLEEAGCQCFKHWRV